MFGRREKPSIWNVRSLFSRRRSRRIIRNSYIEHIELSGNVKIFEELDDGTRNIIHEEHNIVVTKGHSIMALLLGSADTEAGKRLGKLLIGTDDTAEIISDPWVTAPEGGIGTEIFHPVAVGGIVYTPDAVNPTKVTFTFILDLPDAIGVWKEAGLFNVDEDFMFARVTYASITKDNLRKLGYIWEISFQSVCP